MKKVLLFFVYSVLFLFSTARQPAADSATSTKPGTVSVA